MIISSNYFAVGHSALIMVISFLYLNYLKVSDNNSNNDGHDVQVINIAGLWCKVKQIYLSSHLGKPLAKLLANKTSHILASYTFITFTWKHLLTFVLKVIIVAGSISGILINNKNFAHTVEQPSFDKCLFGKAKFFFCK